MVSLFKLLTCLVSFALIVSHTSANNNRDKINECQKPPCLRKCCPLDQVWDFVGGTCQKLAENYQFSVSVITGNESIAIGHSCPVGGVMIPQEKQPLNFTFTSDTGIIIDGRRLQVNEYCLDDVNSDGTFARVLFICTFSVTEEDVEGFVQIERVPLKKCCPPGDIYKIGKGCIPSNNTEHLWPPVYFNSAKNATEKIMLEDFHVTHEESACPEGFIPYLTTDFDFMGNGTLGMKDSGLLLLPGDFCLEAALPESNENTFVARFCVKDPCQNGTTCVKKCCPKGYIYQVSEETIGCVRSDEAFVPDFRYIEKSNVSVELESLTYAIRYGVMPSCSEPGYNLIDPINYKDEEFFLLPDSGSLHIMGYSKVSPSTAEYCVENFDMESLTSLKAFTCFPPSNEDPALGVILKIYPVFLFISVFFLCITFMVYAILPELHNMHGLTTMCLVLCMIITYSGLGIIQTSGHILVYGFCLSTAIVVHFFFLAIFTWLSVMSFDIWFTFSHPDDQAVEFWLTALMPVGQTLRFPQPLGETETDVGAVDCESIQDDFPGYSSTNQICSSKKRHQRNMRSRSLSDDKKKRFILYSLYAWFVPLVIVITGQLLDNIPGVPESAIKPGFGITKCWFNDDMALLVFFYGPIGVICIANIVLFILTAIQLYITSKDTAIATNNTNRKERFRVICYLFIITGVFWIMEVVSFVVQGSPYIWMIPDIVNISSGFLIFYIFVCKPRVMHLLRKRLPCFDSFCKCILRCRKFGSSSVFAKKSSLGSTLHSSEEGKRKSSTTICTQVTQDSNSVASDVTDRRKWC